MENITQTELILNSIQVKEALPLGEWMASIGKKALFFTSMPFYWLVFFTKVINWFDINFFIFVVAASVVMSILGKNWGLLHFLMK